jgi:hypothetical protein
VIHAGGLAGVAFEQDELERRLGDREDRLVVVRVV